MKRFKYDVRDLTDETLASAKAGSRAAIDEVFRATMWLVRWRANTYPVDNDTRDDLISIGHLAVFDAVRTYRPTKGVFAGWVTQWVHARMSTAIRSTGRRETYLAEYAEHQREPEMPLNADEALEADEEGYVLRRAVASLRAPHRAVIQARLKGKTLEQVGKELGITREATRQREIAAIERLRVKLKEAA